MNNLHTQSVKRMERASLFPEKTVQRINKHKALWYLRKSSRMHCFATFDHQNASRLTRAENSLNKLNETLSFEDLKSVCRWLALGILIISVLIANNCAAMEEIKPSGKENDKLNY